MAHLWSLRSIAGAATIACWASATQAQTSHVSLAIGDRHITLVATNVTLRQILDEWQRVGGVRVVNSDRLEERQITVLLRDVTEREALDLLLRDTGGFALSARPVGEPGLSAFGTIVVVPAGTPLFEQDTAALPVQRRRDIAESPEANSEPTPSAGQPARVSPFTSEQGSEAQTASGASDDVAAADADTVPVQVLLPREQWPPTPTLRPSQGPDARNPFGRAEGSTVPGVLAPTEAGSGVTYPRTTNPEVERRQNGTFTPK